MTDTLKHFLDHQIPGELRDLDRWCNWRYVTRDGKPPGKEPVDGASCTDSSTWLSYETARDRWLTSSDNGHEIAGLWFASGAVEDGDELAIAGFDFDHCVRDEVPDERVYAIIRELGSYAEYSPGDGIRILAWVPTGTRSIKRESGGFEFYAAKRWLSVTGKHSFSTPRTLAVLAPETVRKLYERWIGGSPSSNGDEPPGGEKRKPRATRKPKPDPERKPDPEPSGSRRFEDTGVPVEQMARVAKRCLKLLDAERASEYGSWINMLCALRWIHEQTGDESVTKLWHKFSRRCRAKYDEEDAQQRWDLYEAPPGDERLKIGSLLRWASEDSGTPVAEIVKPKIAKPKMTRNRGWAMTTRNAAEVEMEPVRWLWRGRIPKAKLTIVAGDMGDGKSFVCADLAARVSAGIPFPDGFSCPTGRVLIVNTEDDPADTTVPRLHEAGAERSKIEIYYGLENAETGEKGRLNLARDLPLIEAHFERFPDTQLVIIDPLGSFSGDRNLNAYHEVYQTLGPLNEIAGRHDTAILGVVHLNKGEALSAKHRISGSTAILAAARCGWIVLRDPDSDDRKRRLFLALKQNNSAGDDTGLAFRITADDPDGVAHIEWIDAPVEATADEVIRRSIAVRGQGGREKDPESLDAIRFLQEILKDGPVESTRIASEAKVAGTSLRSCKKHKEKLKITVRRVGGLGSEGRWEWCLPEHLETDDGL